MAASLMRIACLHTAESNIAVFEAAAVGSGIELTHVVRADLLAAAELAGAVPPEVAYETAGLLSALAANADAVLLTCSTLGPVADALPPGASPVMRVDRALAEQAVAAGDRIVVLCAVETTLAPTEALFSSAAAAQEPSPAVEIRLVPGAWDASRAGDLDGYLDAIAGAADAAYDEGAPVVALAQSSMAGAVDRCRRGRPLASPATAIASLRTRRENQP